LNQLAVIASVQGLAALAAIFVAMRVTADVPFVPASRAERWRVWALIAAGSVVLGLLTAGLFQVNWPYKLHLLVALAVGGLVYLPLSTSSQSDEDKSPVSMLDWVKVTLATVVSAASLAAVGAYVVWLKL
jgi:hypothetical protein